MFFYMDFYIKNCILIQQLSNFAVIILRVKIERCMMEMFILSNLLKNPKKIKFEQLVDEWLETKKIGIKESTYYNYIYSINKYIMPTFENMKIDDLEEYNFNDYVIELLEELSTKTVRDVLCILKSVLYYVNEEYGSDIKVKKIQSPKLIQEKIEILSNREIGKLERACIKENSFKSMGIIICLNTGLRIGEICALKWENINLERKTIHVKQTLQRVYDKEAHKSKVLIDVPKTEKSIRTIPISSKLYEILKDIKYNGNDENFLLTGDKKKYIEPRNYQKYYKNLLKQCRIKSYKFHILRHTFASKCVEVGMDVKSLSEILGHASVEITLNKYVHSNLKTKKNILKKYKQEV